eukprot:jgi/Mesvir1/7217/Mv25795-RA.1
MASYPPWCSCCFIAAFLSSCFRPGENQALRNPWRCDILMGFMHSWPHLQSNVSSVTRLPAWVLPLSTTAANLRFPWCPITMIAKARKQIATIMSQQSHSTPSFSTAMSATSPDSSMCT